MKGVLKAGLGTVLMACSIISIGRAQSLHVVRINVPFPESPIYLGPSDSLKSLSGRYFEMREGIYPTEIQILGRAVRFGLTVGPQGIVAVDSVSVEVECAKDRILQLTWPVSVQTDTTYENVSVLVFHPLSVNRFPCILSDSTGNTTDGRDSTDTGRSPLPRDGVIFAVGYDGSRGSFVSVGVSSGSGYFKSYPGWQLSISASPVPAQIAINGTIATMTPADISVPYVFRRGRPVPTTDQLLVTHPQMVGCTIVTADVIQQGLHTYNCILRSPGRHKAGH